MNDGFRTAKLSSYAINYMVLGMVLASIIGNISNYLIIYRLIIYYIYRLII